MDWIFAKTSFLLKPLFRLFKKKLDSITFLYETPNLMQKYQKKLMSHFRDLALRTEERTDRRTDTELNLQDTSASADVVQAICAII